MRFQDSYGLPISVARHLREDVGVVEPKITNPFHVFGVYLVQPLS